MLQDTDFFDRLATWSSMGDVRATVAWDESVSPDERYAVQIDWRFRRTRVGSAHFIIEPIPDTDEFQVFWQNIEFAEGWRNKGVYSELVKSYMDHFLEYKVTGFVGAPSDKTAEAIYRATGFEWVNHSFKLDLTGDHIKEWRAYNAA